MTKPQSLLQVSSLVNDNSLLKIFFQRSITWLNTIIISLCHCYVVTFCIWSLYFVYANKNQPTKQIRIWSEKKGVILEGSSWLRFNNLRLALCMIVKIYTSVAKGFKLKVRKFWVLLLTFVEVIEKKLAREGGRDFLHKVNESN